MTSCCLPVRRRRFDLASAIAGPLRPPRRRKRARGLASAWVEGDWALDSSSRQADGYHTRLPASRRRASVRHVEPTAIAKAESVPLFSANHRPCAVAHTLHLKHRARWQRRGIRSGRRSPQFSRLGRLRSWHAASIRSLSPPKTRRVAMPTRPRSAPATAAGPLAPPGEAVAGAAAALGSDPAAASTKTRGALAAGDAGAAS